MTFPWTLGPSRSQEFNGTRDDTAGHFLDKLKRRKESVRFPARRDEALAKTVVILALKESLLGNIFHDAQASS